MLVPPAWAAIVVDVVGYTTPCSYYLGPYKQVFARCSLNRSVGTSAPKPKNQTSPMAVATIEMIAELIDSK